MPPLLHINMMAVAAAVAVSFCFGWLWYGPLFGKRWAGLMKLRVDHKPDPKRLVRSMGLTLLGTCLMAYVLAYAVQVWRPSAWGVGHDEPSYLYGFFGGFFTWIGYFVPLLLGTVAWESRSWSLFRLNASYHFVNLQIIGMILAYWR